jgi:hypothetical protein
VRIDTVRFALAQRQLVLTAQFFSLSGEYPDLPSSYKVSSRRVGELIVRHPWECSPSGGPENYCYGVEAVPFIEGARAAAAGELTRLTQEPDFSGHGTFGGPDTNGSVALWSFLWLGIAPHQAAALLDNHLPRLTQVHRFRGEKISP